MKVIFQIGGTHLLEADSNIRYQPTSFRFGLDMCIFTKYNHHLTHTANTFFNFPQDPTRKRVSTSAIAKRKSQTEYRIENAIFSSSVHSLIV